MFINLHEAVPANQATAGTHRDNYGQVVAQYNAVPVTVNMATLKHAKRIDQYRTVLFFIDGSDLKVHETLEQIDNIMHPSDAEILAKFGIGVDSNDDAPAAPKKRGRKPKNVD